MHHLARLGEVEAALLHVGRIEAEADAELVAPAGQVVAGIGLDRHLQRMVIGERPDRGAQADLLRQARRLADDELGRRLMLADPRLAEAKPVGGDDLVDVLGPGIARAALRPPTVGKNPEFHGLVLRVSTPANLSRGAGARQLPPSRRPCGHNAAVGAGGGDEFARVGMAGAAVAQLRLVERLDEAPVLHHRDAAHERVHHREVVAHQQIGEAALRAAAGAAAR